MEINYYKVEAVQKMQDYIDEHINEVISLKDIATSCGYSPYHAERVFKELTNKTPFDYIRMIRLTKAAQILRDEKVKIIDVAFDFVFNSHEGFTRAFSKEFGLTPKQYQLTTPPIKYFLPYGIKGSYLSLTKGEKKMEKSKIKTVFVQVIERPLRKAIIKRGVRATEYFEYCEEVGCDVWGVLVSVKEALYEPIGMWLPKKLIKENTSSYVQGVEVPYTYNGKVPEGFELIDLEEVKMMVFQGEPYNDEHFEEAIGNIFEVIKSYDPSIYGFKFADEIAPRFQLEPRGYRGYIEARPVVEVNK